MESGVFQMKAGYNLYEAMHTGILLQENYFPSLATAAHHTLTKGSGHLGSCKI